MRVLGKPKASQASSNSSTSQSIVSFLTSTGGISKNKPKDKSKIVSVTSSDDSENSDSMEVDTVKKSEKINNV